MKSQFLAAASHDLRQPLVSIGLMPTFGLQPGRPGPPRCAAGQDGVGDQLDGDLAERPAGLVPAGKQRGRAKPQVRSTSAPGPVTPGRIRGFGPGQKACRCGDGAPQACPWSLTRCCSNRSCATCSAMPCATPRRGHPWSAPASAVAVLLRSGTPVRHRAGKPAAHLRGLRPAQPAGQPGLRAGAGHRRTRGELLQHPLGLRSSPGHGSCFSRCCLGRLRFQKLPRASAGERPQPGQRLPGRHERGAGGRRRVGPGRCLLALMQFWGVRPRPPLAADIEAWLRQA